MKGFCFIVYGYMMFIFILQRLGNKLVLLVSKMEMIFIHMQIHFLHRNQADVLRTPTVFGRPTAEQQTLVSPHVCNNLLTCFDIRPWGLCVFLCVWAVWVWERQREREDRMTADSPAGSQTADSLQPWHPPVSRLRHTQPTNDCPCAPFCVWLWI